MNKATPIQAAMIESHDDIPLSTAPIIGQAIGGAMEHISNAINKMEHSPHDILLMIRLMIGALEQQQQFVQENVE